MKKKRNTLDLRSYKYLLQWLFIAVSAGLVGSLFMHYFIEAIHWMVHWISYSSPIPLFLWPLFGALLVGGVIYSLDPRAKGEGIPSYLISLRMRNGHLSGWETFYKFWAAILTLGTLGNGGFFGPGGRVTSGIMSVIRRIIPKELIPEEHDPLFSICGLAAAFGAMAHSPIGGGIFAVEIIQKANMSYRRLFPAILASTTSVFFSRAFGFEAPISFKIIQGDMNIGLMGLVLLVSVIAGLLGKGFISLYGRISKLFLREARDLSRSGVVIRTVIGSMLAFWLVYLVNPHLLGSSTELFSALLEGEIAIIQGNLSPQIPLFLVLLALLVLKGLANCLTVGSGMSAGFAGPAMLMGLLLGSAFAHLFNIPPGTVEYYALLTAGFAGLFSSTMNTPIATGVIAIEMFGLFYSLPAGLASVIGFQINRHNTLYDSVLDDREKIPGNEKERAPLQKIEIPHPSEEFQNPMD